MALIKCPECGKEISDKAVACPHCGCPSSVWSNSNDLKDDSEITTESNEDEDFWVIDELFKQTPGNEVAIIKHYREKTGCGLPEAKEKVEKYFNRISIPRKRTESDEQEEFSGIYRYSWGRKERVYCPRCGSSNCSHFTTESVIPGKTKTKYTANLNPFKPFTLVNKKEKVVRKEQTVTENKIICNDCGKIF